MKDYIEVKKRAMLELFKGCKEVKKSIKIYKKDCTSLYILTILTTISLLVFSEVFALIFGLNIFKFLVFISVFGGVVFTKNFISNTKKCNKSIKQMIQYEEDLQELYNDLYNNISLEMKKSNKEKIQNIILTLNSYGHNFNDYLLKNLYETNTFENNETKDNKINSYKFNPNKINIQRISIKKGPILKKSR